MQGKISIHGCAWILSISLLCLPLVGCGNSEYLGVTGTVTLDGEPLENGFVQFYPKDINGSTFSGRTDAKGYCVMECTGSQSGALRGEYTVTVSTEDELEGGGMVPELVPAKYNGSTIGLDGFPETELEFVVSDDSREFQFDMTSD